MIFEAHLEGRVIFVAFIKYIYYQLKGWYSSPRSYFPTVRSGKFPQIVSGSLTTTQACRFEE